MCARSLSDGVPCLHRVLGRIGTIVDRCSGETRGIDRVDRNRKVEKCRKRRKSKTRAKRAWIKCTSWNEYEGVTFDSETKAGVKRCVYFSCLYNKTSDLHTTEDKRTSEWGYKCLGTSEGGQNKAR